jgi:ABC-type amino acid transport substrate-binding protein
VGVQIGTTGAAEAQKLEEEGKVGDDRTFNTVTDAFNALKNGQVDAVINDFLVSADRASQSNGEHKIVQNISTGEQYGIAFPTDSVLRQPLNEIQSQTFKSSALIAAALIYLTNILERRLNRRVAW